LKELSFKRKLVLVLFGLLLGFLLAESCMRFAEFIIARHHSLNSNRKIKKNNIRILCLGDSFTYGAGVPKEKAYPIQLENALNKLDKKKSYKVINRGFPGINSSLLLADFNKNINETSPDIVIVLIGGSDHAIYNGINTKAHLRIVQLLKNVYRKNQAFESHLKGNDGKVGSFISSDFEKSAIIKQAKENLKQGQARHLIFLGNIYREKQEYDKSINYYKNALKLDSANTNARLELLRALKLDGQLIKATLLAFELIDSSDCRPEIYSELASISQKASNPWQFIYICNQAANLFMQKHSKSRLDKLKIVRTFKMGRYIRKSKQLRKLLDTAGIYYGLKLYDESFKYLQKVYKLFQRKCVIEKKVFNACQNQVKYELLTIMRHEIGDSLVYNNLSPIVLLCKKKNLRLILLSYPEYLPYSVMKVAEEHSVELLDITKKFPSRKDIKAKSRYFLKNDSHCSAVGNHLIAKCIAEKIMQ